MAYFNLNSIIHRLIVYFCKKNYINLPNYPYVIYINLNLKKNFKMASLNYVLRLHNSTNKAILIACNHYIKILLDHIIIVYYNCYITSILN